MFWWWGKESGNELERFAGRGEGRSKGEMQRPRAQEAGGNLSPGASPTPDPWKAWRGLWMTCEQAPLWHTTRGRPSRCTV